MIVPTICTVEELDTLWADSEHRDVWLLKHSLACGTSFEALRQFQQFAAGQGDEDRVHAIVEIQPCRELSDTISERTGVRHQSPQALLLRGGEVVWKASHWSITAEALAAAARRSEGPRSQQGRSHDDP